MTTEAIMQMAAQKVIQEYSWETIEFLFRPTTVGELLFRLDFDGFKKKFYDAASDTSPYAMPHRFRDPYIRDGLRMIKMEEFYRKLVIVKNGE